VLEGRVTQRTHFLDDECYAARILDRPLNGFDPQDFASAIRGRRIAVTGAGGFIGSCLVRRIATLEPARIALVENCEYNLYTIADALAGHWPNVPHRAIYCDVRDHVALDRHFAEERPEIVLHVAALKHLPLMEDNPREAVLTNVIGTRNVTDSASGHGAEAVVAISTDKAVEAVSVLGATKRLAEAWCQAMDFATKGKRFVSVRFGNVFGSTGSVAPRFANQIAAGRPLTLTDRAMTRYFITPGEASGLVLGALALALDAPEPGLVYLLESGDPVRIEDIARRMIAASGRHDLPIEIIGARPGEKIEERLVDVGEHTLPTRIRGIRSLVPHSWALSILRNQLAELEQACLAADAARVIELLSRYLPGFSRVESREPERRVALAGRE